MLRQAPTVETLFPIEAEALKSLKLQAATVPPDLHWGDAAGCLQPGRELPIVRPRHVATGRWAQHEETRNQNVL